MKQAITLLAFILYFGFTNAQITKEVFESFKLQEERNISYYIPENYTEEKKYPLILVLDADYLFDHAVANAKYYSSYNGMPEAIVVGIHQSENNQRANDCGFESENGLPTENGKKFFEFIGMELIPHLEKNYTIAPFKMFIGYDITANFGNFYLFKEQSLFNSYVSISPTLAPEMESRIPTRLAALESNIFYHLILEGTKNKNREPILAMDKAIKEIKKESLHYFFDEYSNADHISIVNYSLGKVFDDIFGMFKPISTKEFKEKILTSEEPVFNYLENKYKMLEDIFGFKKTADLNDIMAIYAAAKKKDFESLKPLSDLCKKEFPGTMLGFYFEGEYYEQLGEPKKALRTFEKAFGMDEIDFLTKDMAIEKMDALKVDFGY
ncbi:MAG: alpha/beta hydrolase-fold protein [Cellulophaga sp.]